MHKNAASTYNRPHIRDHDFRLGFNLYGSSVTGGVPQNPPPIIMSYFFFFFLLFLAI